MNKIMYMFQKLYYQLMRLIPPTSGRMLNNKWVLYFIFVVGLFDLINFYQRNNLVAVAIFAVVGFLTSFFSKNMIVILVMAIAVTHLVTYGNREGLKNEGEDEEEEEEEEEVDEGFEEGVDEDEEEEVTEEEEPKEEMMTTQSDNQTTELLKKQNELMEKMNQLEPLLDKAESLFKTHKTDGFQNMKSGFSVYK